MTRVVGGTRGGRRLVVPPGGGTRPTSDRAREGLFSTVAAVRGDLSGARVLDLYAGSGAVGLEALSRGAAHALLVEAAPRAARVARANAAALALPGAQVRAMPVARLVSGPPPGPAYDLVFLDPPYDLAGDELARVLADLVAHGWVAPGGLVVVERASRDAPPPWPPGVVADRARRYGEATLWYGRAVLSPAGESVAPAQR
ncbi:MAG: 16S rRNA (guanine(966)-N(2))-methyltransferase RsmD [Actinomycetota bacterium]